VLRHALNRDRYSGGPLVTLLGLVADEANAEVDRREEASDGRQVSRRLRLSSAHDECGPGGAALCALIVPGTTVLSERVFHRVPLPASGCRVPGSDRAIIFYGNLCDHSTSLDE
jgi:hypothetical protein